MMPTDQTRCLVIGSGKMGYAHCEVFADLIKGRVAVWAPTSTRQVAIEKLGIAFYSNQLEDVIDQVQPTHVVVASPVETLTSISKKVLSLGIKNILIEKPAFLNRADGLSLMEHAKSFRANICIGYNRRFYSSILTAEKMIKDAGETVDSVIFEFNEQPFTAEQINKFDPSVRERWLICNSMHVIDSAFLPTGLPDVKQSSFITRGSTDWHRSGGIFAGSGLTDGGAVFSYHANWHGPGRWNFCWITRTMRYIFCPLETLGVMPHGSFVTNNVDFDAKADVRFKPGLYRQNNAFLNGDSEQRLVSLERALSLINMGSKMAGYD